jgi:hypothetical protein
MAAACACAGAVDDIKSKPGTGTGTGTSKAIPLVATLSGALECVLLRPLIAS